MSWRVASLLVVLTGLGNPAAAQTISEADAIHSPACLAARERLDALMAQDKPDLVQLRAARQRGARACFRTDADLPPPARADRPVIALPPPPAVAPARPATAVPTAPLAPAQPAQVARCDEGGCWDSEGRRLDRAGNRLIDPQGRACTQQGTVLSCP